MYITSDQDISFKSLTRLSDVKGIRLRKHINFHMWDG